ncbi:MAG: hypothetical protein AB1757_26885 [Acidobacteriota bacterium]
MIKFSSIILLVTLVSACNSKAPTGEALKREPFLIQSSIVDPTTQSLVVQITLSPPVSEQTAKTAAETVIERHKSQYKNIIVRAYTGASPTGLPPLSISTFDGTQITHQINNALMPQKIPSH